jgi:hypothetical protein
MDHFAGLDVSVKDTSVCIVDDTGKIVREVKVASEPEALLAVLKNPGYHFKRIGLEAGPLSQFLSAGHGASMASFCGGCGARLPRQVGWSRRDASRAPPAGSSAADSSVASGTSSVTETFAPRCAKPFEPDQLRF